MFGLFSLSRWRPDQEFVAGPLNQTRSLPLRLDRFPLGVDNAHIDVVLPETLTSAAADWIHALVNEEVRRSFWRKGAAGGDRQPAELFRSRYDALSRIVVHETRARARPEWIQLYFVALLRLLLSQVDTELVHLRQRLEQERSDAEASLSGRALTLHERLVTISRYLGLLRFRCCHQVMRQWSRQEQAGLRKLRETVLGVSWPVPEAMLFNPLLELGNLEVKEAFLNHYPLMFHDGFCIAELQDVLLDTLKDWLPSGVKAAVVASGPEVISAGRLDQGGMPGYIEVERRLRRLVSGEELSQRATSWFDQPENITLLLGGDDPTKRHPGPWRHPRWRSEQKRVLARLERRLQRSGLLRQAAASYALMELFPTLSMKDGASLLYKYMSGDMGRQELVRRLEALPQVEDPGRLLKRLKPVMRQLRQDVRGDRARLLTVRLATDFCRYRRDLKQAWQAYSAMDGIRLLGDPQEIALSRANGLLQVFHEEGDESREADIIGHVILKADVRGSTRITAQMRERNLNPAAYFSRNLYDPINSLLNAYGASKVFVEGDAVILMLVERDDMHLAVARACGLARKILGVIKNKNAESRRHGLPELELGLGIAYCDEPPTYLYDEGHRITISPAINRSDQLSSCHPLVKTLSTAVLRASYGLEVMQPVSQSNQPTKDMEDLLRYNVNGIELDAVAFQHLRTELKLQTRMLPDMRTGQNVRYYVGRFPDTNGAPHWLVVRESPVWLMIGNELVPGDVDGRSFYEVVSNPELMQQACAHSTDSEAAGFS